jgi:hypothetical protein
VGLKPMPANDVDRLGYGIARYLIIQGTLEVVEYRLTTLNFMEIAIFETLKQIFSHSRQPCNCVSNGPKKIFLNVQVKQILWFSSQFTDDRDVVVMNRMVVTSSILKKYQDKDNSQIPKEVTV